MQETYNNIQNLKEERLIPRNCWELTLCHVLNKIPQAKNLGWQSLISKRPKLCGILRRITAVWVITDLIQGRLDSGRMYGKSFLLILMYSKKIPRDGVSHMFPKHHTTSQTVTTYLKSNWYWIRHWKMGKNEKCQVLFLEAWFLAVCGHPRCTRAAGASHRAPLHLHMALCAHVWVCVQISSFQKDTRYMDSPPSDTL